MNGVGHARCGGIIGLWSGTAGVPRVDGTAHLKYGWQSVVEAHAARDCPVAWQAGDRVRTPSGKMGTVRRVLTQGGPDPFFGLQVVLDGGGTTIYGTDAILEWLPSSSGDICGVVGDKVAQSPGTHKCGEPKDHQADHVCCMGACRKTWPVEKADGSTRKVYACVTKRWVVEAETERSSGGRIEMEWLVTDKIWPLIDHEGYSLTVRQLEELDYGDEQLLRLGEIKRAENTVRATALAEKITNAFTEAVTEVADEFYPKGEPTERTYTRRGIFLVDQARVLTELLAGLGLPV